MNTIKNSGLDYSGISSESTTTGAGGGLASVGAAMQKAFACGSIVDVTGTTGTGAGRLLGIECWSMGDALASRERAAGPMLAAAQAQLGERIVMRSANKLRARMAGDGREVGDDSFRDAQANAFYAVELWRAGVVAVRGDDGGDKLTAGADFELHVARVAWRALVAALSDSGLGQTSDSIGTWAEDWLLLSPGSALIQVELTEPADRRAAMRAALVDKLGTLACGRGRRAAAIERVGNVLGLLIGGDSLEAAATAAGFKACGRTRAGDSFLRAARRLELVPAGFTSYLQAADKADKVTHDRAAGEWTAAGDYVLGDFVVTPFKPAPALALPPLEVLPRAAGLRPGSHCGAGCVAAARVRSVNLAGPSAARLAARAWRGAAMAARSGVLR